MWTKISGKVAIVTGANTGIGYEVALALYKNGAHVVLACRDIDKAQLAIEKMEAHGGVGTLEAALLQLDSLQQVRAFAEAFMQRHQQLHLLINNAGVAMPPASTTVDGYELQFGVNFLGHFALTGLLYPLLLATPAARIVTVTSNGYQQAAIDFDNLKSEKGYDAMREYRQSKLANLIFSIELDRRIRLKGQQVISVAAQPGANKTELMRHLSAEYIAAGMQRLGAFMEPWQGALSVLYAAVSDEVAGGQLYEPEEGGLRGNPCLGTIQDNAMHEEIGGKLWDFAAQATGVREW